MSCFELGDLVRRRTLEGPLTKSYIKAGRKVGMV